MRWFGSFLAVSSWPTHPYWVKAHAHAHQKHPHTAATWNNYFCARDVLRSIVSVCGVVSLFRSPFKRSMLQCVEKVGDG